jgi:hypothetical protein
VSNDVMSRKWAIGLLIPLFAGLWFLRTAPNPSRLQVEDDIREAVFRYQFQHNASGQQKQAGVYCLSVGEKTDPSDELIKRFAENKPPVHKISECTVGPFDGVVDQRTHTRGLVFRVGAITWISETEVEATGGYYEGGLSSSGNTYTVRKRLGKWTVTKDKMNWISTNLEGAPLLTVEESRLHSEPTPFLFPWELHARSPTSLVWRLHRGCRQSGWQSSQIGGFHLARIS